MSHTHVFTQRVLYHQLLQEAIEKSLEDFTEDECDNIEKFMDNCIDLAPERFMPLEITNVDEEVGGIFLKWDEANGDKSISASIWKNEVVTYIENSTDPCKSPSEEESCLAENEGILQEYPGILSKTLPVVQMEVLSFFSSPMMMKDSSEDNCIFMDECD